MYGSREHATFEELIRAFLAEHPGVDLSAACFGVAGAVVDGRVRTTNLPWTLEETALAKVAGVRRCKLLNDIEAAAYGMLCLGPEEISVLNQGESRPGNASVVAVGTGLGEALLYWDGTYYHPVASEGGHGDFAPTTDEQAELWRHLRSKFGHVSYERVLSGPGLLNVYSFLRDSGRAPEPPWLTERFASGDRSAVVTEAGLGGTSELCVQALALFAAVLGAEAGNVAMRSMATGGIFLGGGIPPKLLPALQTGAFMQGFVEKGRFREFLERVPVKVALNLRAPLIGAAQYALRLG